MANAIDSETGRDRTIITEESITSRGRFRKGSLMVRASVVYAPSLVVCMEGLMIDEIYLGSKFLCKSYLLDEK